MEKHSTITGEFAYILVTEFGSSPVTYGFHFDIALSKKLKLSLFTKTKLQIKSWYYGSIR